MKITISTKDKVCFIFALILLLTVAASVFTTLMIVGLFSPLWWIAVGTIDALCIAYWIWHFTMIYYEDK